MPKARSQTGYRHIASIHLAVHSLVPRYAFRISAKRYLPHTPRNDGLTLIFAHGTGFHKEQWEVAIDELFGLFEAEGKKKGVRLREAWSLDCPNHGDAAVLNEEALEWGYERVFDWQEYARYIHLFLTTYSESPSSSSGASSSTSPPRNPYFASHSLVPIGHSMGGCSLILTHQFTPWIKYHSLVLCEVMLFPRPPDEVENRATNLEKLSKTRRDIWPSKPAALEWMKMRKGFQSWHPKVLEIYAEHGLRPLPSAAYPDKTPEDGVTLKCPKVLEGPCYADTTGKAHALKYLPHLCSEGGTEKGVHMIYGGVDDHLSVPHAVQDLVIELAGPGLKSVVRVPGAGHLFVQTHPVELAGYIWKALSGEYEEGKGKVGARL